MDYKFDQKFVAYCNNLIDQGIRETIDHVEGVKCGTCEIRGVSRNDMNSPVNKMMVRELVKKHPGLKKNPYLCKMCSKIYWMTFKYDHLRGCLD